MRPNRRLGLGAGKTRDRLGNRGENSLERWLAKVESFPVSAAGLALYFAIVLFLRETFEQFFLESSFSVMRFEHHFFFFLVVLLAGILGISRIGKIDIARVTRVVASGYILLILPPLIDHFLFRRNRPYDYVLPQEWLRNVLVFFRSTPKAGPGIILEILAIVTLAGTYVFLRSRSPVRALAAGLFLYLLASLSVTPRLFLPLPPSTNPEFWASRHLVYFCFNLVLAAGIGFIFMRAVHRPLPGAVVREVLSFRTLHFLVMAGAGLYLRGRIHFLDYPDVLMAFLTFVLMGLIWTVTVLINDVYDLPIDRLTNPGRPLARGVALPAQYLHLAFILALVGVVISLALGPLTALITVVSLLSALLYSVPPVRLRMRLFSNAFIAWGSVLAFYLGYFALHGLRFPTVSAPAFRLSVVIFLALFLGSFTKDLKDYEGDLRFGNRTIFTVFGLARGRAAASILLGLSLLTPLLVFHRPADALFFSLTAAVTGVLFHRRGRLGISFVGYGVAALYAFGRLVLF